MSLVPIIYAATGHRPNKLGGWKPETDSELVKLAAWWLLPKKKEIHMVISGMALGWDLAIAEAALSLGIDVFAAIPCHGQDAMWPKRSRDRYAAIGSACVGQKIIHEGPYNNACMQARNQWMVNACDEIVALYDGTAGGTGNCVEYAESRRKPITNLWSVWEAKVYQ